MASFKRVKTASKHWMRISLNHPAVIKHTIQENIKKLVNVFYYDTFFITFKWFIYLFISVIFGKFGVNFSRRKKSSIIRRLPCEGTGVYNRNTADGIDALNITVFRNNH